MTFFFLRVNFSPFNARDTVDCDIDTPESTDRHLPISPENESGYPTVETRNEDLHQKQYFRAGSNLNSSQNTTAQGKLAKLTHVNGEKQ